MQDNLKQEIENLVQGALQNVHTCIPGTIVSFNAGKCLAVVTPSGQFKTPAGKLLSYPQVHDVPVVLIQSSGQDVTVACPIEPGDGCLLFFSEQQLDRFRDGEDAKCDLRFDLTNAIAVMGLFRGANSVIKEACDKNAVIIDNKGARLVLGDGKLLVDCDLEVTGKVTAQQAIEATGSISTQGEVTATGVISSGMDVVGGGVSLKTHPHTVTGEVTDSMGVTCPVSGTAEPPG